MKEINLYIRGYCNYSSELPEGKYIAILEYKNRVKKLIGKNISTTENRMILQGLLDVVRILKEPCVINYHTHTYVGLQKMKSKKGEEIEGVRTCANKDMLIVLKEELKNRGHKIIETVGQERQKELAILIKKIEI